MGRKAGEGAKRRTPEIVEVPIEKLIPAAWNYKRKSTPEEIERLAASIAHDESPGVPAVREIAGGKLEVIDGNHRLEALLHLGWKAVRVENFGKLSDAEAVVLAQRRNHQWFEDDQAALAHLFKDVVVPEIGLDTLETFMPLSRQSMEALVGLTEFNWESPAPGGGDEKRSGIAFPMTDTIADLWPRWMEIASVRIGDATSKVDAFELLLKVGLAATKTEEESE